MKISFMTPLTTYRMVELTESAGSKEKAALFLSSIKKSTAELHSLLESNQLLSAIISPGVTLRHYFFYLLLMKKIEEVYEKHIVTLLATLFPGGVQRKASLLLAEDIQTIGYILPQSLVIENYTLPIKKMPLAYAFGFMYVMEGSKLGGKVISKHIQQNLGFSESSGAKFVSNYGVNTTALWRVFLSKFSEYVVENDCEEEAIRGANGAFKSIYDYFESNLFLIKEI